MAGVLSFTGQGGRLVTSQPGTSSNDPEIFEDTGVGIEYQIPQRSKRIDVLLSGRSPEDRDGAVIVELKQWETADLTEMDGIVRTVVGGYPTGRPWSAAFRWDLTQHGSGWLAHPDSISEVGCIHTCQGLELGCVGVEALQARPLDPRLEDVAAVGPGGGGRGGAHDRAEYVSDAHDARVEGCYVYAVDEGVREWLGTSSP